MDAIMRKKSVCRSLFGPVDHEQLRRELKQRMGEISEQDSRRWNFNFHTEEPMPGRFQWEEVPTYCAAAFYQEPTPVRDAVCYSTAEEEDDDDGDDDGERLSSAIDQENCPRISNTSKGPAERTPVRRKRTLSKPSAKPRHNARITDFFSKRRRTTETKSNLAPFHKSSSEAALCKTIR